VTLAILLFDAWVLLPVAGFCVAYPQLAFTVAAATMVALVPLALLLGAGRAEAPRVSTE
jgi:hypothetical protein